LTAPGSAPRPVDEDAWRAGHAEGLRAYCTAPNALALGRAARSVAPVCPDGARAGLAAANAAGREEFWLRREVQDQRARLHAVWSDPSRRSSFVHESSTLARLSSLESQLERTRARNEAQFARQEPAR
jgi:hypothetical protein